MDVQAQLGEPGGYTTVSVKGEQVIAAAKFAIQAQEKVMKEKGGGGCGGA